MKRISGSAGGGKDDFVELFRCCLEEIFAGEGPLVGKHWIAAHDQPFIGVVRMRYFRHILSVEKGELKAPKR
jgi:hypothetical protein